MGDEPAPSGLGEVSAGVERACGPYPVARIAKGFRGRAFGKGGRWESFVKERSEGRSAQRCHPIPGIMKQSHAAKEGGQRRARIPSASARCGAFPLGELHEGGPIGATPLMALPEAGKYEGGEPQHG